jgi:hypothetical protein
LSTIRETLSAAPHRETATATPITVFAARAAGWTLALGVGGIALWGLPYYAAPLALKVRDPLHAWLRPSGTIGQALGLLAFGLFMFLWLYPLRKKLGRRPALGAVPRWLDVHIVAGLLVPFVAAVHAGFRFEGLIGLGYASMAVVCASGLVGRYLYVHIPRTKGGVAMTLDELALERRQLLHDLATAVGRPMPDIERRLAPAGAESPTINPLRVLGRMVRDDLARRSAVRRLRRELAGSGVRLDRERTREVVSMARREMALTQQAAMLDGAQRIFKWWHAAHRPFAITALVAVLLHVGVAIALGQTWFR